MSSLLMVVLVLILVKTLVKLVLERLNVGAIVGFSNLPDTFKDFIDKETHSKSMNYTKAKSKQSQLELVYGAVLLITLLFTDGLSKYSNWFYAQFGVGSSVWLDSLYLFSFFFLFSLLSLPFSLYSTFGLEQKYGFNTMTFGLWLKDFIKTFFISVILTLPLLALIFFLVNAAGIYWWIWAWAAVVGFQFLMLVFYPKVIIPLFNKLTPLAEGELRDQILELAKKLQFDAKDIMVMDGSKRSKHSNAFFTGIGKSRRVVFFDTLVEQLSLDEMKAVFAHEIGHYKKKHIVKSIVISVVSMFVTFFVVDFLMNYQGFNTSFGLEAGKAAHTFLILSLFGGLITFWFSPISNIFSRKNEYEADAFARVAVGGGDSLVGALKKLYKENLSNLTPHSLYSFFYYSHPTLVEREKKLVQEGG